MAAGSRVLNAIERIGNRLPDPVFLFPWAVSMFDLSHGGMIFAFWSMMVFLGVLTIGFIYEWKKGALEWQ